jgi:dTDP-4-dehydrorhamnose reductase
MLALAARQETVQVVDDQYGQPTWSYRLALRLAELGRSEDAPPGIYHGTSSGQASWYELARAAFELAGLDPERVRPTDSSAFRRPAARPSYSVLGHDRWSEAGLPPLPHWRDCLGEAFQRSAFRTV